eukprot:3274523-Pyramimonas_sp.AAC.1
MLRTSARDHPHSNSLLPAPQLAYSSNKIEKTSTAEFFVTVIRADGSQPSKCFQLALLSMSCRMVYI